MFVRRGADLGAAAAPTLGAATAVAPGAATADAWTAAAAGRRHRCRRLWRRDCVAFGAATAAAVAFAARPRFVAFGAAAAVALGTAARAPAPARAAPHGRL